MIVRASEQPLVEGAKSPLVSRRMLTKESFAGAIGVTWIKLSTPEQNPAIGRRKSRPLWRCE